MVKGLRSSLFSLEQLSQKIKDEEITPSDLVELCLYRIKRFNPILNAFITVIEEEYIYKQAQLAEKQIKEGNYFGPLHGIPFSIKDIFYAKNIRCTAGSKILSDYISDVDSTVVKRIKETGGVLVGTNNLNEFASGITGKNPFYGSSKNPWNTSRISGGSSGGSAVAVASGMAITSLGTDTGGSARVPASFCGVVGLKPTYGRISRYGVVPLAPSFDHVGCITRSAWDAGAVLECIAGWDPLDQTAERKQVPTFTKIIKDSRLEKIPVVLPTSYFFDLLHPEVEGLFSDFIEDNVKNGAIVYDKIYLQNADKYFKCWRDIRLAEATEVHSAWLKTRRKDYSKEVRKMLIQGSKVSAVAYIRAKNIIREIRDELLSILRKKMCVIIVPTTIIPAPGFDDQAVNIDSHIIRTREALLRNSIIFNSTGLPAVSIPIGLTKDNTPIGAQIIGPPFKEDLILSVAYKYECTNSSLKKFIPPLLC
jgi:aspartyl-tRNA(Asn)/glutamyl-tRNA(Gln) amidotransferase subunit A